ncbi:MAG: hypothetical protein P9L92_14530 [Candidatus Electryonea clarkiae]|nr:hypothetical protein [Candidatus Electryonea clarkiae]
MHGRSGYNVNNLFTSFMDFALSGVSLSMRIFICLAVIAIAVSGTVGTYIKVKGLLDGHSTIVQLLLAMCGSIISGIAMAAIWMISN